MPCIESLDHVSCTLRRNKGGRVRYIFRLNAGPRRTVNESGRIGIEGALGEIWGRRMADGLLIFLPSIDKHIGVS